MRRGTKRHGAGSRTLDGQQDFDRSRATKPHATSKPRGPHTWDSSYDAGALEQAVPSSLQANAQKGSGGSTDDRQSLGFLLDVALRGRGGAAHDASKQPPAGTVPSATSRVAGGEQQQQQQQQQEQQQQQQQAPPAGAWPFHGGAGGSSPPVVQGKRPMSDYPDPPSMAPRLPASLPVSRGRKRRRRRRRTTIRTTRRMSRRARMRRT